MKNFMKEAIKQAKKALSEEAKKYADYNGDGKVSSSDYVLIKNYIMSR